MAKISLFNKNFDLKPFKFAADDGQRKIVSNFAIPQIQRAVERIKCKFPAISGENYDDERIIRR